MKRNVIFVSVQAVYVPTANDILLTANDTDGKVWTKWLTSADWVLHPSPVETVH